MKVTVNRQAVAADPAESLTLDELLDSLRSSGGIGGDQAVVGIRVGSRDWTGEDFDLRRHAPLAENADVAIATDGLSGYGARLLEDVAGMVRVLQDAAGAVAARLRTGELAEANGDLFRLLDALQRLLVCLYQLQNSCGLACGPADADEPLLNRLSDALDTVAARQEAKDWPALADGLEHSLGPVLDEMGRLVEAMQRQL